VTEPGAQRFDAHKFLEENPAFKRRVTQFMVLHDAVEVLADLKPPNFETAAAYLGEIANHLMDEAGVPADFVRAMVAGRPPLAPEGECDGADHDRW
jgi:hypothetical protein